MKNYLILAASLLAPIAPLSQGCGPKSTTNLRALKNKGSSEELTFFVSEQPEAHWVAGAIKTLNQIVGKRVARFGGVIEHGSLETGVSVVILTEAGDDESDDDGTLKCGRDHYMAGDSSIVITADENRRIADVDKPENIEAFDAGSLLAHYYGHLAGLDHVSESNNNQSPMTKSLKRGAVNRVFSNAQLEKINGQLQLEIYDSP